MNDALWKGRPIIYELQNESVIIFTSSTQILTEEYDKKTILSSNLLKFAVSIKYHFLDAK